MPYNNLYGQGGQVSVINPSIAVPGLVIQRALTKDALNTGGSSAQVITITIGTPAPATLYSLIVNGVDCSFTTPSAITAADLQSLIFERLVTRPAISGNFNIERISTTGIRLTALLVGFDALISIGLPMTFTNVTSRLSSRAAFGRIVTGRGSWVDNLQVAGLPTATTEAVLGATQFSHGLTREPSGLDGFGHGDAMSLVSSGSLWMEFNAMVINPAAGSRLHYQALKSPTDQESGKLFFGVTPPAGYSVLPGVNSLDSQTSTIGDGRIVGLVSLSV